MWSWARPADTKVRGSTPEGKRKAYTHSCFATSAKCIGNHDLFLLLLILSTVTLFPFVRHLCVGLFVTLNIASANTASPTGRGTRRRRSQGYTTTEITFQFKTNFWICLQPFSEFGHPCVELAHFSSLLFHKAPVHFNIWLWSASWAPVWTSNRKKIRLQTCTHRFTFSLRFMIQLLLFYKVESDGGPFLSDPGLIRVYACHSLTDSLTDWRPFGIDVTTLLKMEWIDLNMQTI